MSAAAGAPPVVEYIPKTTIEEINNQILQLNDYNTVSPAEIDRLYHQGQAEMIYWVREQEELKNLIALRNAPVAPNNVPQVSQEINNHGQLIEGGLAYTIHQLSELSKLRFEHLIPAITNRRVQAYARIPQAQAQAQARGGRRRRETKKRRGRKLTRRHR